MVLGTTTIYFIDTNTGCQSKLFPITVIDPVYKIIGYTFRDVNGNGILIHRPIARFPTALYGYQRSIVLIIQIKPGTAGLPSNQESMILFFGSFWSVGQ
ncbi:MAG: hypothetical protein IPJ13_01630 [Saprospiraceae bacterium]|nr:hypothetical protein [Saprospiraceae bacterium]